VRQCELFVKHLRTNERTNETNQHFLIFSNSFSVVRKVVIFVNLLLHVIIATVAPKEDDDSLHILTQLLEAGSRLTKKNVFVKMLL